MLNVLHREGYILGYNSTRYKKKVQIFLKYYNNEPTISKAVVVSKNKVIPSITWKELRNTIKRMPIGIIILSTHKGVLSHRDALRLKIGGSVLAEVW